MSAALFTILYFFEIMACVIGLVYRKRLGDTVFKWFPVYLVFVVFSETLGRYVLQGSLRLERLNQEYFNYFEIPTEFIFFFWLFYKSESFKFKSLPLICSGLYLLGWITDIIYFSKHEYSFYSFSYTLGNLLLLVVILRYFVSLVTSNHILSFWHDMLFWIGTGQLIYYLGTFPFYGLRNTLCDHYQSLYATYTIIMCILNSSMYLMFSLSFIWGRPNTGHLSSSQH